MMRCGFINRPFKAFRAADLPMNAARFYLLPAGRPAAETSRRDHHQRVDRLAPAIKAITAGNCYHKKWPFCLCPETLAA
jgi:hypothetical protein